MPKPPGDKGRDIASSFFGDDDLDWFDEDSEVIPVDKAPTPPIEAAPVSDAEDAVAEGFFSEVEASQDAADDAAASTPADPDVTSAAARVAAPSEAPPWVDVLASRLARVTDENDAAELADQARRMVVRLAADDALALSRFGRPAASTESGAALVAVAASAAGDRSAAVGAWRALEDLTTDADAIADVWLFQAGSHEGERDQRDWLDGAKPHAQGDPALLLRMAAVAGAVDPERRASLLADAAKAAQGRHATILGRLAAFLATDDHDLDDDALCPADSPTPAGDLILGLRHGARSLVSARLSDGQPNDAELALAAVLLSAEPPLGAGPAEASAVEGDGEAVEGAISLLLRAQSDVPRLAAAARLVRARDPRAAGVIAGLATTDDERIGAGFCGALAGLRGGDAAQAAAALDVAASAGAPVARHALLARLIGDAVGGEQAIAAAEALGDGALELWRFVALSLEDHDPESALSAWERAGSDSFALEGAVRVSLRLGDPARLRDATAALSATRGPREAAQLLMFGLLGTAAYSDDEALTGVVDAALAADPACRPALDLALQRASAAARDTDVTELVQAAAGSMSPEAAADLLVHAAWLQRRSPSVALSLLDAALGLRARHFTALTLRPFFAGESLRLGDARHDGVLAACEQVLEGGSVSTDDPAVELVLRLADALAGAPRARPDASASTQAAAALLQADRAAAVTMLAKAASGADAPVRALLVGGYELGMIDTLGWAWSDEGWSDSRRARCFIEAAIAASASAELIANAAEHIPDDSALASVLSCLGMGARSEGDGARCLAASAAGADRTAWLRLAAATNPSSLDASSLVSLVGSRPTAVVREVVHRELVRREEPASVVLAHGAADAEPLALAIDLLAAGDPAAAVPVAVQASQRGGVVAELVAERALEACDSWEMLFHLLSQRRQQAVGEEREHIEARRRWVLSEKLPDTDAAWELFQALHTDHPEDRGILENLARIAGARGEIALGVDYLRQLAESASSPEDAARCHRRIAEVYRRALRRDGAPGEPESDLDDAELRARARQSLLDALDYQPDDREAISSLADLAREADDLPALRQVLQREVSLLRGPERVAQLEEIARISERLAASPEEAVEGWREVLEADAGNRFGLERLVALGREHGLHDVLLDAAGALTGHLDAAEAAALLHEMGEVAERLERPDAALEYYEQSAGLETPDCRSAQRLVDLHEQRGDREGVVRALAVLGAHAPTAEERGDAYLRAARIEAEHRHDRASAAGWYEAALSHIPDHPEALRFLVAWMFEAGRIDDALPLCARLEPIVAAADVDDFDTKMEAATFYYRFGEMLRSAGRPDDALERFRLALDLNPAHLPSLEAVAPLLLLARSWAEAEVAYRKLLQLTGGEGDPERVADLYTSLGIVERELGRDDGGYRRFHRALEVLPNYVPALQGIAAELERREDWNNLLTVYNNIIYHASQPQDVVEAYLTKGRILDEQLDRADKAWQHFERTLAFDGQQPRAYIRIVELSLRKGSWDDARSWSERGIAVVGEHDPLRADLLIGRAIAAAALDEQGEADAALSAAFRADPGLGTQMRGVSLEDRAAWLALLRGRLPR